MKKIGILVYDASLLGGAEKVAIKMAQEFSISDNVHLISVFCKKKDKFPYDNKYATYVLREDTVSITKHFYQLSKVLRNYLEQNQVDVLFAITAGVVTMAITATSRIKTKTVYCEHSNLENRTYGKKHELRQYLGAKFSDKIVTLTQRDRDNFIRMFRVNAGKVSAIPNWIVCNIGTTPYCETSKKIISAGRLEKVKGYDLLIQVAKQVYDRHPDWSWDIYGDGTYREIIQADIDKEGLHDFVTLKGAVQNIEERYKEYSLFIMTSYYEGLPLVLLEAQVEKLPIVSFDCPTGPSEIICDNKNGFLVPTYEVGIMAEKINTLIEDVELRKAFSNQSHLKIGNFSKESVMKLWRTLIEQI